jgi:eukaryotic-like serine/threonine-protein kinase
VGLLDSLASLFGGKGKGKRVDVAKRFDLLGRTGQGSMSKVWRARDRNLGKVVCLKILDKEKTAKFEARFVGLKKPREGEVCVLLRHDNIVRTFEHGVTTAGEPFLVMELVDGQGLNLLIETNSNRLAGKRAALLAQVASALDHLHKQGFLHRDICPRNVMVTNEGVAKLIDFGLAIPNRPEFCKPGNRTGTPDYLAPEIIRRVTTDQRVDLFALGVTAYEMFTGQMPWEKARSEQTLMNHMNQPGRDPREFKRDLDPDTATFLLKAIDRDRDQRFQTAAEFRDVLLGIAPPY